MIHKTNLALNLVIVVMCIYLMLIKNDTETYDLVKNILDIERNLSDI